MKQITIASFNSGWAIVWCILLAGCSRSVSVPPEEEPPTVLVSYPVQREVTDFVDFTGRTSAVHSVDVRARVAGYLESINFTEGALVKQGDVLFVIDQRPFVAELNRTKAKLEEAEAQHQQALTEIDNAKAAKSKADAALDYARRRLARTTKLLPTGAATHDDFDLQKSELQKAEADVQSASAGIASAEAAVVTAKAAESSARAAVAVAELDLGYTTVVAPASGRISRHLASVGNLVQAGQNGGGTLLTTIVSVDPMNAYFAVDEHTVLRVQQMIREGRVQSAREVEIPVWLGLANEEGYPHRGTINFVDNQVRPNTGTMWVRGVFPNSDEALTPGLFVRIRVPVGEPHSALLVADRALGTDQGQKVLYVVGPDDRVESRPVRVGALHDGLREIVEGLKPGERVISEGLHSARPGSAVTVKLQDDAQTSSHTVAKTAIDTSVSAAR